MTHALLECSAPRKPIPGKRRVRIDSSASTSNSALLGSFVRRFSRSNHPPTSSDSLMVNGLDLGTVYPQITLRRLLYYIDYNSGFSIPQRWSKPDALPRAQTSREVDRSLLEVDDNLATTSRHGSPGTHSPDVVFFAGLAVGRREHEIQFPVPIRVRLRTNSSSGSSVLPR